MSVQCIARITAFSIIFMAIAAAFAMSQVFVDAFLLEEDLLPEFLKNSAFKTSLAAWLVILICDLIVSWGCIHITAAKIIY